ncbi:MAG: hypothetical protein HY698_11050 [Deltaproteobacteria bacterium]|nr:hypothetical protein [Deltaproteobacteria bacterium]
MSMLFVGILLNIGTRSPAPPVKSKSRLRNAAPRNRRRALSRVHVIVKGENP